ncbi:MAG TPA: hypothetical protein VLJ58_03500, partial [Ramlibacter sp.]|nr:hypothetical protein [Ramlibacter sp.]
LLPPEDIKLLTEVGFLASARADVRRAETVFGALEQLRPDAAFPYVGAATALLNAGRAEEAVAALDRGLAADGQRDAGELQAFRGLALQLAGRASESVRAMRAAGDTRLARAMLGELSGDNTKET